MPKTRTKFDLQEENLSSGGFCHFSRLQSKNKRRRKTGQIPGPCLRAE